VLQRCNRLQSSYVALALTYENEMTVENPSQEPEDEAFREAVRKTAYFLWEQDGRPHGRHEEYYLRALDKHRRERRFDEWLKDEPGE
jgi:hypothetical protein